MNKIILAALLAIGASQSAYSAATDSRAIELAKQQVRSTLDDGAYARFRSIRDGSGDQVTCGEVATPSTSGFKRFVVAYVDASFGFAVGIEGATHPPLFSFTWSRYCAG